MHVTAGGQWGPSSSTRGQCRQVQPSYSGVEYPLQAGFQPHSSPLQLRAYTAFTVALETPINGGNMTSECEKGYEKIEQGDVREAEDGEVV